MPTKQKAKMWFLGITIPLDPFKGQVNAFKGLHEITEDEEEGVWNKGETNMAAIGHQLFRIGMLPDREDAEAMVDALLTAALNGAGAMKSSFVRMAQEAAKESRIVTPNKGGLVVPN